jgi:hypothetical protein
VRTFLVALLASIIAFTLGVGATIGGLRVLEDATTVTVIVRGEVRYQGSGDPTASVLPPEGYYIESSGFERVYLPESDAAPFVGKAVQASGRLTTVCGPDGSPCYPLVRPDRISALP